MTIATAKNTPRNTYTASGGQTVFAIGFEFFATGDIKVFRNGTALTFNATPGSVAQFSVQGTTNASDSAYEFGAGGTVTLGGGATADDSIVIVRDIVVERTTDFTPAASFDVTALNTQLDVLMAMMAEREESSSRSIRLPLAETTTGFDMQLPVKASRANKILEFDGDGDPACTITASNLSALGAITGNVTTVAGIASNVTTVAGIASNVTAVAGDSTDIGAVAAVATEIGRLGTSDAVADLAILGTSAIVTDMDLLGTSANVAAMGHLGTSANVTAMGLLGTSTVVADMALLGTSAAVADMALLANSDVIADMALLATSDIISDLNTLATSDIVTDINVLATSDIVSDLNTLATSAIVADLNILATSDIVTDINLLATSDVVSDLNTLATSDFVSDLNTLASSTVVTNIATVATNVAGVNSFAARYRITGGDPGSDNDAGDLNYNTSDNALKYFNGSSWVAIAPGIANVVEDTTPQLGGNLASNGNDIIFADNDKAIFGASSDLNIFHDGSNSFIQDLGAGDIIIYGSGEDLAHFKDDGAVELYHNGTKKFETASSGVDVVGTVNATTLAGTLSTAAQPNITSVGTLTSVTTTGNLAIGTEDNNASIIEVNGAGAGGAEGGEIRLDMAADHDSTYNHYRLDVHEDDFRIGRAGTTDITLNSSGNVVVSNKLVSNTAGAIINRNNAEPIFINGAMELWQRGTALASSSGNYAADRFWYAGTGMTSQRSTDVPSGFNYSNKLTYGSADMALGQPIELPDTGKQGMFISGQKFTFAFYGKVASGTEAINVGISFRNSKFSSTNLVSFTIASPEVTLTTDWQRFTKTFTIPTVNANNTQILCEIINIGKTAFITGIQGELGEYDTTTIPPFQHEATVDNLQRCQRYFQTIEAARTNTGSFGHVESSIVQTQLALAVKPRFLAQYQGSGTLTKVGDIAINSFPSNANTVTGIHNWVVMGNSLMFGMTTSETIVNGSSEPVRYGSSNGQTIFTLDTEL